MLSGKTPKITVKNPKNLFAFQIGHIEIGKVSLIGQRLTHYPMIAEQIRVQIYGRLGC